MEKRGPVTIILISFLLLALTILIQNNILTGNAVSFMDFNLINGNGDCNGRLNCFDNYADYFSPENNICEKPAINNNKWASESQKGDCSNWPTGTKGGDKCYCDEKNALICCHDFVQYNWLKRQNMMSLCSFDRDTLCLPKETTANYIETTTATEITPIKNTPTQDAPQDNSQPINTQPSTNIPSPVVPSSACIASGTCKDIIFTSPNNVNVKMDIYYPTKGYSALPVVIYIHGGAWAAGDKSACTSSPVITKLRNSRKFVVVCANYRLSGVGTNPKIPEYPMQVGAIFPAQIYDLKNLIRWVRANGETFKMDSSRIGVYGVSAGGQLSSLLGTSADLAELENEKINNYSSRVQAVVSVVAPSYFYNDADPYAPVLGSDDYLNYDDFIPTYFGGDPAYDTIARQKALLASPGRHVSADDPKFFIIAGTEDPIVSVKHAEILAWDFSNIGRMEKLKKLNMGHSEPSDSKTQQEILDFFLTMPKYVD